MALKCPNVGEERLLGFIRDLLSSDGSEPATLYLYTNNYTPTDTEVLADYTAAGTLELGQQIANGVVTPNADAQGRAICEWDELTFELLAGGPTTFYGWVLVDSTDTQALMGERFPVPVVLSVGGNPLKIVPRLTLRSEF